MTQPAERLCREVYEQTRILYDEVAPQLGSCAFGFRIMYGPPIVRAPVLFIGYQPGGTTQSAADGFRDGEHIGWPSTCVYADADWKLAARLRAVWGAAALKQCTGLNAIFVRAPTMKVWSGLPQTLRARIEEFSIERAKRLTLALQPQRIVVIGLGIFDRLTTGEPDLKGRRRTLVKRGDLWGAPAYGVVHLSGARVSGEDMSKLASYFANGQ